VPARLIQVTGGVFLEVGQLVGLATALDPGVFECLRGSETLFGIEHEHLLDKVLGCARVVSELCATIDGCALTFRGHSGPISVGELELTLANTGLQLDGVLVREGWVAAQSVCNRGQSPCAHSNATKSITISCGTHAK
jgi:hypothetical protein